MSRPLRVAALGAAALLAACSSGHGSALVTPSSGTTSTAAAKTRSVGITLTIPDRTTGAKRRVPAYVSTATQSARVTVTQYGAGISLSTDVDLSAGSTSCVAVTGGRACTFSVSAPIQLAPSQPDTFAVKLFSDPCTGGPPCTTAANPLHELSVGQFTGAVVEGAANFQFPLILGGIPATETLSVGSDPGPANGTRTVPVTVTAKDASGNVIIGSQPYADTSGNAVSIPLTFGLLPSTISTADPKLLLDGVAQIGPVVSVGSPADTLAVQLAASQANVGVAVELANQSPQYLHITGSTAPSIAPSVSLSSVYGVPNGRLAAPPLGTGTNAPIVAAMTAVGSDGNIYVYKPIPTSGTWLSIAFNSYCSLPSGSTSLGGIAVASDGSFYATYRNGTTNEVGHFTFGPAHTPCPESSQHAFTLASDTPGPVAISPSGTILAIDNVPGPSATAELLFATTDFAQTNLVTLPSTSAYFAQAVSTLDNTFWLVDNAVSFLYAYTGSGTSYTQSVNTLISFGCGGSGIVTDGTLLYIGCNNTNATTIVTPNGTSNPVQTTINTTSTYNGAAQPIALGPDGGLWIIGPFNTNIQKFDRLLGGSALASTTLTSDSANAIAAGVDGDLWLTSTITSTLYRLGTGAGI